MAARDIQPSTTESKAAGLRTVLSWRLILMIGVALMLGFSLTYFLASQPSPSNTVIANPDAPDPVFLGCQGTQCGDGYCENGTQICTNAREFCSNCPQDCGPCEVVTPPPTEEVICGDGHCEPGKEGAWNCVVDCGNVCGDDVCAADEVNSCCGDGLDCTLLVTCGTDGICSACENFENCPQDCEPVETEVPTEEPTDEPTEVVTEPPDATDEPTEETTEQATETPTATSTATETPTATATETPSPTPEPEEACGLVPYESRPGGWKQSYGGSSEPGDYIPINDDNLEVYVCDEPPSDTVCIPLYGDLLDLADGDEAKIQVLDCPDGGECRVYEQVAQVNGDEICFNPVQTAGISCGAGCAFAPLVLEEPGLPLPLWALGLILLILLLLLLLLFILFSRRRREAEEEETGME